MIVAKGKKTVTFDMKKDPPEPEELEAHVLGRSGTLRAPTLRMGKTFLVGYGDATWDEVFG